MILTIASLNPGWESNPSIFHPRRVPGLKIARARVIYTKVRPDPKRALKGPEITRPGAVYNPAPEIAAYR